MIGIQRVNMAFIGLTTIVKARLQGSSKFIKGFSTSTLPTDDKPINHFVPCLESDITSEMVSSFHHDIRKSLNCDAIVVGSGLSGLSCVYHMLQLGEKLKMDRPPKITLIEKSFRPGGNGWAGTSFFNSVVVRKPAHHLLESLGVSYQNRNDKYVVLKNGIELTSKLLNYVSSHSNVSIFTGYEANEILLTSPNDSFSPVRGVAVAFGGDSNSNGNNVSNSTNTNMTPLYFNTETVVCCSGSQPASSSGLRQNLRRYSTWGWADMPLDHTAKTTSHPPTDVQQAEDYMVSSTREVSNGLFVAGSELCWLDGCAQSGPTVGGRLQSGLIAAQLAMKHIEKARDRKETRSIGLETASHFLHDDTLETV